LFSLACRLSTPLIAASKKSFNRLSRQLCQDDTARPAGPSRRRFPPGPATANNRDATRADHDICLPPPETQTETHHPDAFTYQLQSSRRHDRRAIPSCDLRRPRSLRVRSCGARVDAGRRSNMVGDQMGAAPHVSHAPRLIRPPTPPGPANLFPPAGRLLPLPAFRSPRAADKSDAETRAKRPAGRASSIRPAAAAAAIQLASEPSGKGGKRAQE